MYTGHSASEHDRFTFARASQLPGLLEGELQELEEQERQLSRQRYCRERHSITEDAPKYFQQRMNSQNNKKRNNSYFDGVVRKTPSTTVNVREYFEQS